MTVAQSSGSAYGLAALRAAGERVEHAAAGARNVTLFEAARSMGQLVGSGQISNREAAEGFLVEMGCQVGISAPEARRQVRNGLQLGARLPQRPRWEPEARRDDLAVLARFRSVWEQAWRAEGGGRTRGTVLRLVAALCLAGVRAGSEEFGAGHRFLADLSGTSPGTVTKRLADLAPFFERVEAGDRTEGRPSRWKAKGNSPFTEPTTVERETFNRLRREVFPFDVPLLDPAHGVWLGWSNGWRVFCLLAESPWAVGGLVERTGLSRRAVERLVARLAERSLARREEGRWVAVFDCFDDESVAHVADQRAARRRRERLQYLHFLVWRAQAAAQRARVDPRTGKVLEPGKRVVLGPGLFLGQLPERWRSVLVDGPPRLRRPGSDLMGPAEAAAQFRFCLEHREYVARRLRRAPG